MAPSVFKRRFLKAQTAIRLLIIHFFAMVTAIVCPKGVILQSRALVVNVIESRVAQSLYRPKVRGHVDVSLNFLSCCSGWVFEIKRRNLKIMLSLLLGALFY